VRIVTIRKQGVVVYYQTGERRIAFDGGRFFFQRYFQSTLIDVTRFSIDVGVGRFISWGEGGNRGFFQGIAKTIFPGGAS